MVLYFGTILNFQELILLLHNYSKCNLILPHGSSNSGIITHNYFKEKGLDVKTSYTISSNTTRIRLALWGAGIAVIEDMPLDEDDTIKSEIALPEIKIGLVTQKRKIASYSALKLIDYILGKEE